MGMVPEEIWGTGAAKPGDTTQYGCLECLLLENTAAPVDVVYLWGGTSYCRRHAVEARNRGLASG